jgi:hypothetical protein
MSVTEYADGRRLACQNQTSGPRTAAVAVHAAAKRIRLLPRCIGVTRSGRRGHVLVRLDGRAGGQGAGTACRVEGGAEQQQRVEAMDGAEGRNAVAGEAEDDLYDDEQ